MATCRSHGARKPETVKRGKDHPQYKHGASTQEAKEEYRQAAVRLRELEAYGFRIGLMSGPVTRGRKPKA